jgi:hypothetical protein
VHVSLKAFILSYVNISRIIITKGAMAKYSQVKMLLGAFLRDLCAKVVMKLEMDRRGPSMLKYDKFQNHVMDNCASTNTLPRLHSDGARTAPGVSTYSVPAGTVLLRISQEVNHLSIPTKQTPLPAQAAEKIPIMKGNNTINMAMDHMMNAFEVSTFHLSEANESR